MKKVTVAVALRESILDPQGVAVKGGLSQLGFAGVKKFGSASGLSCSFQMRQRTR